MITQCRSLPLLKMTLVILAAVIIGVACSQEPDLGLDLANSAQPSFTFSGRTPAMIFEILELPKGTALTKTNPFTFNGETIWKITSPQAIKGGGWPSVKYGDVPDSFSQLVPSSGSPPKLTEDRLYAARIVGDRDAKTTLFFQIRNSKAVNVTDKLFDR